jgi:hypothetical protein
VTGPHDPEDHPGGEEEPWYGTGYDDEAAASHGGGYDEEPTTSGAVPDPSSDGPASQGPVSQGPASQGPSSYGSSSYGLADSPSDVSSHGPTDPPTEPGWASAPGRGAPSEPFPQDPGQPSYQQGAYQQSGPSHPPTQQEQPAVAGGPSGTAPRQGWWRSRRVRVGAAATLAGLVLLGGGFGAGYAVADASTPPAAAHATAAAGTKAAKGQAARKRREAAQQRRQQQEQGTGQAPAGGTGQTPGAVAVPSF